MIYANYHSHSSYCDGTGELEDYVKEALKQNLKYLGLSGHAPLPFPNDWTMTQENLGKYLKEAEQLKYKYKFTIELYTSLEIDFIENVMGPSNSFYHSLGLDYSIGSVHVLQDRVTGEYPGIDYTEKDIEQLLTHNFDGDPKALVQTYYTTVRKMIREGGFTILGHLDVIKKTNINSKYFNENEPWYRNEIIKTLNEIKAHKQMIEVNTGNSRWNGEKSIYPSPWILSICRERDIPVVLNSDAHIPKRITSHFNTGIKALKEAGYTESMLLLQSKWVPMKIE